MSAFEVEPTVGLVDAVARQQARQEFDRPLLVEAGAGTGKTTLLVERVVEALERDRVHMPGLVAISFTEKAAAELRLRIRQEIERRLGRAMDSDAARQALVRALREIDRARISTIHAFAASILREQPVQTGVDPRFRTLDELESRRFLRTFWERWLDEQLESEAALVALRPSLLCGVRLDPDLFRLALELELQRDVADGLVVPQPAFELEALLQKLRAEMQACIRHGEENCHDSNDPGLRKLAELAHALAPLDGLEPSSWPGVFLGKLPLGATAGRQENWAPGAGAHNKAWRKRLQAELAAAQRAIGDTLLHGALGWLTGFRQAYAAEKQRRGVLDFQDLLVEARRLVRDYPDVRRDLAARIDMLCVDEFQDTDPLQAELVLFLAETGGPARQWLDVRVGPKLFLVGDPKQSIYRFRRADPDVYARCARIVEESGGLRIDVRQNFRSRPAILDWVNATFETLFARSGDDDEAPRHVPLAPTVAPSEVPAVWILRPEAEREPASGSDGWRRDEARALVAWLRQAIDAGFPVRSRDGIRSLRAGDVAMLFARTSGIEHYETALRDAGLPFQQEGGRLFFQRQEVRDVLHALAAVDDPHDELSIATALRSPLFGTTDAELWEHRAAHGTLAYTAIAPDVSLASRLQVLSDLHAERHTLGVAGTIVALLDRTEARAVFAARTLGAQALANIEMLERLARQFEAAQPAGLREFVRSMRDVDEDAPRLAEWSPQEDTSDRVRLLTVHVSKGLDFPCVLLANLAAGSGAQATPLLVDRLAGTVEARLRIHEIEDKVTTAGYDAVRHAETSRDRAEERRLLYVAATRARDYLVVGCHHGDNPRGLLEPLLGLPAALGVSDEPFGDLPIPGRGWDVPGDAPWRVLVGSDLAPVVAPRRLAAPRADLRSMHLRRAAWPARHAARLERGGASGRLEPPRPLDLRATPASTSDHWMRLRGLVARALGARIRPESALEFARRHGAADLGAELRSACSVWEASSLGTRAAHCTHAWYGLPVTVAVGTGAVEMWLDLVVEEPAGGTLVEFVPAVLAPEAAVLVEEELLWKAALLSRTGLAVGAAGRFDLGAGSWWPVEDFVPRLAALPIAGGKH